MVVCCGAVHHGGVLWCSAPWWSMVRRCIILLPCNSLLPVDHPVHHTPVQWCNGAPYTIHQYNGVMVHHTPYTIHQYNGAWCNGAPVHYSAPLTSTMHHQYSNHLRPRPGGEIPTSSPTRGAPLWWSSTMEGLHHSGAPPWRSSTSPGLPAPCTTTRGNISTVA